MKKIMIQKITQNNWNFWIVNLIMRAKKIVNQSSDFPVRRTGSYCHKKALQVSAVAKWPARRSRAVDWAGRLLW